MSNIRQLLAIDPDMSVLEAQRQLGSNGIHLHRDYLTKLVKKHLASRSHRIDRKVQSAAIAQIENVCMETIRRAWPIVLSQASSDKDKLTAINTINNTHFKMFELYQTAGIFDKKLGTVDVRVKVATEPDPRVAALVANIEKLWLPPRPVKQG